MIALNWGCWSFLILQMYFIELYCMIKKHFNLLLMKLIKRTNYLQPNQKFESTSIRSDEKKDFEFHQFLVQFSVILFHFKSECL